MAYTASLTATIGQPTKKSDYDKLGANTDFLRDDLENDHNFDIFTGTGYHKMRIDSPMHIEVDSSTVWSMGWWESGNGQWWLLINTADVASFVRADAEMYLRAGDIRDVPAS